MSLLYDELFLLHVKNYFIYFVRSILYKNRKKRNLSNRGNTPQPLLIKCHYINISYNMENMKMFCNVTDFELFS